MHNLGDYLRLPLRTSEKESLLSLVQQPISGGRIERDQIDEIRKFPNMTGLAVSGLTQDTFDYLIENYGHQFKLIHFWKCPLVRDLRKIELLEDIEYILYFWNQRAERLWDLSKTKSLKGFSFDDFTRMHDLSELSQSPSLEELYFGNKVWVTYSLDSLAPLRKCRTIRNLSFSAKKINDGKIEPLADLPLLERLAFPTRLFSTEQVAWLKAHLPSTVDSRMLNAFLTLEKAISIKGKNLDSLIVGRRKPFLDSVRDKTRITKYVDQFNDRYDWYLQHPLAAPEDFNHAG